ncbi:7TM diverse intracellular signaling domain-containing protein [Flavobacterium sp. '19STA2R22 D10 B1']|uniref:7TM diverse intracellular signaling domain-containing protein n=1 Tax=Flavobacterium aerium TaxID=3037261 RepID=UPI00278BBA87|nr:7TM diverse intracellular signaling domain-containing protein [Flavobacterium sp. '19STA2R22 D10 B1']
MNKKIFLFLLFFSNIFYCAAQDDIVIEYYHTLQDTLLSSEISQQKFIPYKQNNIQPRFSNAGIYWFRIKVNKPTSSSQYIMQITNPRLDSVYLYKKWFNKTILLGVDGNNFKQSDTSSYLRYVQFKLGKNPDVFYLKTSFKKDINLPIHIKTEYQSHKDNQFDFFILGLYYGFATMILFVNLFYYITLKDKKFLYYCFFLITIVCAVMYTDGMLIYITKNHWWLNHGEIVFHLSVGITGTIFATAFLELETFYPKLKWLALLLVIFIITAFSFYVSNHKLSSFMIGEIGIITLITLYWVIGLTLVKKHFFSRFFVIGYGLILFVSFDFFIGRAFGFNFLKMSQDQLKIASSFEILILSWTISYRVKLMKKENSYYRDEINKYIQQAMQNENNQEVDKPIVVLDSVRHKFNLTDRELEVLNCIVEGLTNTEIADKLYLSVNTIKYHTRNIYEKLNIKNRTQAVAKIHENPNSLQK